MKISDILTSSDVIVIDDAVSKKRLLQEMSRKLAEDTGIDERTMFDIVAERENLGSTGFGGGTAPAPRQNSRFKTCQRRLCQIKQRNWLRCLRQSAGRSGFYACFSGKQRRRPLKCVSANFQNHQRRGTLQKNPRSSHRQWYLPPVDKRLIWYSSFFKRGIPTQKRTSCPREVLFLGSTT